MTLWRAAAATSVLLVVAACAIVPPFRFRAEVRALRAEAAQSFPVGSDAASFEAWFVDKAGSGLFLAPQKDISVASGPVCEPRLAVFDRLERCMNRLSANYCVDPQGRLTSLALSEGGYC